MAKTQGSEGVEERSDVGWTMMIIWKKGNYSIRKVNNFGVTSAIASEV